MLLPLLIACNPWADVHQRELIWYDADRVENELGIDLVDLPNGEPIGYWARIVIQHDHIAFDNRAWFLALDPAFFQDEELDHEFILDHLIEEPQVLRLDNGRIPSVPETSQLIEALYTVLLQQRDRMHDLHNWRQVHDHPSPQHERTDPTNIVILAGAEIPWETIQNVMYTAAQAGFNGITLAGRVDNRIRATHAFPPEFWGEAGCGFQGTQVITRDGGWFRLGAFPAVVGPEGCNTTNWTASFDALTDLTNRCQPFWQSQLDATGNSELAASEWACTELNTAADPQATYAQVAQAMAAAHQHHPTIQQTFIGFGTTQNSSCQFNIEPSTLSADQLKYICTSSNLVSNVEHIDQTGRRGWVVTDLFPADDPELITVFPEYGQWQLEENARIREEYRHLMPTERTESLLEALGSSREDAPDTESP